MTVNCSQSLRTDRRTTGLLELLEAAENKNSSIAHNTNYKETYYFFCSGFTFDFFSMGIENLEVGCRRPSSMR